MEKRSVLFVDDEPRILNAHQRNFVTEGYFIHTANNGEERLNMLKDRHVDLIIADQKMPGISGIEFLERTIDIDPEIIKIILTGAAELEDAIRAINNGCIYKFILKPWNDDDLKITVRRALEQRELIVKYRDLNDELKKREALLQELERKYPGITKRPEDGIFRIE